MMRGVEVCQPGLTCANGVAEGRKSFSEQLFPCSPAGVASLGVVCPEVDAPHGVKRAGFSQNFGASAQKICFIVRFSKNLAKAPARTASSRTRSQTALSKLRTPRPMRLCARGSAEDIMSSSARWSWKRRAFPAIMNCSAQEYDTPSTTNDDGDHCENRRGVDGTAPPAPLHTRV